MIELEERTYQLIALYQPMAKDMREIACMLKIISSSERIGRYGKDIANMVKHLKDQPEFVQPLPILHMAGLVSGMIDDAIHAFESESIEPIKDFSRRDDTVDSLWHSVFRETLTFMMENPKTITRGTYYIMVARYLERSRGNALRSNRPECALDHKKTGIDSKTVIKTSAKKNHLRKNYDAACRNAISDRTSATSSHLSVAISSDS